MSEVRIGTSGWVYKHWRRVFYPAALPERDWFSFYARTFDTVEINNSFYRLPSAGAFESWREQAPPGFIYALKASRYLTHMKKLKDPDAPLELFFSRAKHLKKNLGPVLYQLPPHWAVNLERFEEFLAALPKGFKHVIEFRDPSWLIEDVFRPMERHGVAHCIHDMVSISVPIRVTAAPVYLRFHGDASHGGDYTRRALETWGRRIDDWRRSKLEVFAYFNNDVGGYALKNANTLRELLEIRGLSPHFPASAH